MNLFIKPKTIVWDYGCEEEGLEMMAKIYVFIHF